MLCWYDDNVWFGLASRMISEAKTKIHGIWPNTHNSVAQETLSNIEFKTKYVGSGQKHFEFSK